MTDACKAQGQIAQADGCRSPLPEVMARVADEIAHIAGQIREVDEALGALLNCSTPLDVGTCQKVDLVRQEMEGVQGFLRALSDTVGPDGLCDPVAASRDLRLAAQKHRFKAP
jgi:hypothetical protein